MLLFRPHKEDPDRVSLASASTSPVSESLNVTSTLILPAPSVTILLRPAGRERLSSFGAVGAMRVSFAAISNTLSPAAVTSG